MIVKKPNFFILGAPKCGTTSLAYWLSEHKNIFVPHMKEPQYFNSDHLRPINSNLQQYEELYKNVTAENIAIGEASTYYLISEVAVQNMLEYNPEVRLIICTRDPAEMAYSLYLQKKTERHELAETFEEAWELSSVRAAGEQVKIPSYVDARQMSYALNTALGSHIKRVQKLIPKERLLIIPLSHIAKHPRPTYLRTLDFLGVPDDGQTDFPAKNPATRPIKNPFYEFFLWMVRLKQKTGTYKSLGIGKHIGNFFQVPIEKPPVDAEFMKKLRAELADEISQVELLTQQADEELRPYLEQYENQQHAA